jgi:hypothetical protein
MAVFLKTTAFGVACRGNSLRKATATRQQFSIFSLS